MRNGLLGSLLTLLCTVLLAAAQEPMAKPSLGFMPGLESAWQPPNTEHADCPNIGPAGYRYYGNVDYILWWTAKDRAVPSLTAASEERSGNSSLSETTDFGALLRNGGRAVLGTWLDQQQRRGVELGGFWLGDRSPRGGGQTTDAAVRTQFSSQLSGAEAQVRAEVYRGTWAHFDFLAGFRYLSFDEALEIAERDFATDVITSDRFATRNRFYAGQLGAEVELHHHKYFVDIWGKVALGANCESIGINGTTLAAGQAVPGGILASPAIAGRHRRDEFAVAPEFGINLGYHLTQHLRVTAGYTFFYLSDAARPGQQIDVLSHTSTSSPFPFQSGDFWMQGLNLGFEFRF